MGKRANIQDLLEAVDKENVKENAAEFHAACQRLGLEVYRRSLRKNTYKIVLENPRENSMLEEPH